MTQQDDAASEARAWTPPSDAEVAEILRRYDRAMDVKNANEETARAVAENLRGETTAPSSSPSLSTALPSAAEIERDVAELRASRGALVGQTQSLVRAMARDASLRAAVAEAVGRGLDLGGKALEAAADRAPEILGRALGALLEDELAKRLPR